MSIRELQPLKLVSSCSVTIKHARPAEASRARVSVGICLLYLALAITSAPLFDGSIDAELVTDDIGTVVKKNASFAPAYFLETGFLNFTFLNQSTFSNGACSILDSNGPECILMTGHQGGVSAYGLSDIGGLVASGTWVENGRESVFVGLKKPPSCVNENKLQIIPDLSDIRGMSGAFIAAIKGPTTQWFDFMDMPTSVRERMFYVVSKQGTGQGLTIPSKKRQSFDRIIASNTCGSTLADKLEIATPYQDSKYVNVILYRIAGASITLPRLQFTFVVAAQALALLVFMILVNARNGALNTYHLIQQLLRLPTFCIIAVQLVYVLYYQVFDIMYLRGNSNSALRAIYDKKIVYVAGVSFILLHQLDVRAAVTLWPKMANNDAYYFSRMARSDALYGGFFVVLATEC
ncbi:uncharacterized protein PITG_15681 [Phytophthora infestans T30-4]|uniref:Transmembrane protein n=1 Tax=Phytophthora infestans (strain T30-4) TaxID=403677 RepID=D0NSB5_PHYIT|nr:uncharacterized protein PITG_15681 [Phytophthora infestans T30-4]EEY64460.1 conserved hypothetical protein [Phytophthora infestans T30-4]|eukprot:XP_002897963.1 conserved hypothetical protein [Phytophthora infestans T30-4]